ncbi:hypothetical protein C8Q69DRAFT_228254 [Paecilomyces variotii]|uniref:Fungal-type protein kinase domain-containing protein n=1 Tax=Byssochlamys spectabilis TaxID=264951 RepID=A0A443HW89_BYSSP|nr:hypothetical protein C8Q69DRAFT_228254 [Paecilomyces variotii]KAJ9349542.1 hypothetical protein DTO280E4_8974 [Paecilomyces variotii]RWQ96020.1 hypothetical protein C8Q69DRAFT_228254 [Paecilomyces variotii]
MERVMTIYESFSKPLPPVDSDDLDYNKITSEATSTKIKDAIRVLTEKDPVILLESAREALQATPSIPERLQRPMSQHETSHYLHTESDVLRVSALQLIHPVNVILSGILSAGVMLRCQSEVVSQKGKARMDLKWYCRRGGKETAVAVLEYKSIKVLRLDDWKPIITGLAGAAAVIAEGSRTMHCSLLEDNALKLSRQVKNYAEECKDIALFDWFSIYIFDFEDVDEDQSRPFPTRITYSSDSSEFRSLLLGMIYNRLKKEGFLCEAHTAL